MPVKVHALDHLVINVSDPSLDQVTVARTLLVDPALSVPTLSVTRCGEFFDSLGG